MTKVNVVKIEKDSTGSISKLITDTGRSFTLTQLLNYIELNNELDASDSRTKVEKKSIS
ncbi:hypothetical protein EDC18_1171 [Natranaerovirga pectinivora]|uniref:Uncharacterized protein n=1 Tax=Natranaerovirga pectinivora TaxID=682400 RepID=A0A4R3MEP7_9FIRM|nr:hypothetical protein [Natranaerovirga pectinivora]TCT11632.1 hypothetical protein EDC18_1171 [Natranaerovirga pectinivora]